MTFPGSVDTITVTALDQQALDGTLLNGVYIFTPSTPVYVSGVAVLVGSAVLEVVNGVGTPIVIPATDAMVPNFTYTIATRMATVDSVNPVSVSGVPIPVASGPTVDISDLLA